MLKIRLGNYGNYLYLPTVVNSRMNRIYDTREWHVFKIDYMRWS